jgi:hypothetical protein
MFHLIEDNYPVKIIFDSLTFLIGFGLLTYILHQKKVTSKFFYIFIVSFFSPLFFNNFLFDWTYFLDQSKYLFIAQSIRNFEFNLIKDMNNSLLVSGIIYSLFPTPLIESFTTISIISRFIFLITLIYVLKEYLKDKLVLFFFLFCPSIILYTSVGLRETFLIIFSILFFFNLKNNKIYYAFISVLLLTVIKPEVGLMLILSLAIYHFLFFDININFKATFLFLGLLMLILVENYLLEYINKRYIGYYYEEFFIYPDIYENFSDIFYRLPNALFQFTLSPLFQITNIFRFFQSIENIIIYIYLFLYFKYCYNLNKLTTLYWLLILFLNLSIYSLVVVNPGSIARYKITLFIIIILSLKNFTKKNV